VPPSPKQDRPAGKLSYKNQRELSELPGRLERISAEIATLAGRLADPGLYGRDAATFTAASDRMSAAIAEKDQAEQRWLELEMLREEAESSKK
jgi:ATP-binding cassette subfamily F protein uup